MFGKNLLIDGDFDNGVYTATADNVLFGSSLVTFTNQTVPIGWIPSPGFDNGQFNGVMVTGILDIGNNVGDPMASLSQSFADEPGEYQVSFNLNPVENSGSLEVLINTTVEATIVGLSPGAGGYTITYANGQSTTIEEASPVVTTVTFSFIGTGDDTLTFSGATNRSSYGISDVSVDQVLLSYTWKGGGANNFIDTENWNLGSIPTQGDTLTMNSGNMNIEGYILPLATNLIVNGRSTLNISGESSFSASVTGMATINLTGDDVLLVNSSGNTTVNIGNNSEMLGTFSDSRLLTITGNVFDNGSARDNAGYSSTTGIADAVVDAKVIGTGIFNNFGGTMEFMRSVGSGQTVNLVSSSSMSLVKLADPVQFSGQIDLTKGAIELSGLGNVSSFGFDNDVLSLYVGKKLVDTLKIDAPNGFNVERSGNTVAIYTAGENPLRGAMAIHT